MYNNELGFSDEELIIRRHIFLVRHNPDVISQIPNPDKRVQMAAVKAQPSAIKYIKSPDPDVQMYVVKRDISLLALIDNPCATVIEYCAQKKNSRTWFIR